MEPERIEDPGRWRVSDREREDVVSCLGRAAAEGRLTLDEYADRSAAAYAAKTRAELAVVTADLPTSALSASSAAPVPEVAGERLLAVFGSESRKGAWSVPGLVRASAVFGDCTVDLRNAQLRQPVTVIEATAVFGSVTVIIPEGVGVRLTGTAVFGSKESKMAEPATPGGPCVEVRSRVWFGSVTVRPPFDLRKMIDPSTW